MIETTFPLWRRGEPVSLHKLLESVPWNTWTWVFLEFSGSALPPSGRSLREFERRAATDGAGYRMTWHELQQFAANVQDASWILLVATDENRLDELEAAVPPPRYEILEQDLQVDGCHLVMRLADSSMWWVAAPTNLREAHAVVDAIQHEFGETPGVDADDQLPGPD